MLARGIVPAALLVLAGCGGTAQPAAGTANSAGSSQAKPAAPAASGLTKLLVLYSSTSSDTVPSWVALDGGYFQKHGLDVELRYVAGGNKTITALVAGESQISEQGGAEAMSAVTGGADLMLVAGLMPVYPFKFEAVQGINSVADLKGKKIAVSGIGGTADVAARVFLRKHGLDPVKDVNIVAVGDPATVLGALKSGAVDASLSAPPNLLQAEAAGTHAIADLASEQIPNAQVSVTVQRSWLNANRTTVQKFVDSHVEALVRIKQDKAFTEQVMAKYLKYDDQKGLDYTYDFYANEVWPAYPHVRPEQLSEAIAELGKTNEKIKSFDPAAMLDDSFVQDAEKRSLGK